MASSDLPRLCRETGLTCEACTEHTAKNLARVCQGLPAKAVTQIFVGLYPDSACAPMHAHFARAYAQGRPEDAPRRGPLSEEYMRAAGAVA